jgi:hypothetical protein
MKELDSDTPRKEELMKKIGNIVVRVSVSQIALFSDILGKDTFIQKNIPGYRLVPRTRLVDFDGKASREIEQRKKYRSLQAFAHMKTNNKLRIYTQRRHKSQSIPPVYLVFDSSYFHPLKYRDVRFVQNYLEKNYHLEFGLRKVHVAIDLITGGSEGLLHLEICNSIRVADKVRPSKQTVDGTLYFGSSSSGYQLIVYDKAKQLLRSEGIRLGEEVSRIEVRLISDITWGGFVNTIVNARDWSWLYGDEFAFHRPIGSVMEMLGKVSYGRSIWELRELMSKRHRVKAAKFYRDYLTDHEELSEPVRKALAGYRW